MVKQSFQSRAFLLLGVVSLIYIVFLSAFYSVYHNSYFFKASFEELGVYRLGNETDSLNAAVLDYLNDYGSDGFSPILLENFQEKERSHLSDVKQLLTLLGYLYVLAWAITAVLLGFKKVQASPLLLYSGIFSLVLLFLLFLGSFSFDNLFLTFHEVFFPQGNYYFPSGQYLITRLYPEAFFANFFARILLYLLLYSGFLCIFACYSKAH